MCYDYLCLIPSYQPDELLLKVVSECLQAFSVIVVDDGSGPEYEEIFARLPKEVKLLRHEENQGKGQALKTGFKYIKEHFADCQYAVVTVDGDGQHTFDDALKVIKEAEKNDNALILGSRNFKQTDQKKSKVGNFFARSIVRLVTKSDIYDTQTGLRAFTKQHIDTMLDIGGSRYEYETNMLLVCSRKLIPIIETKIETIYIENNKRSHYNALKDTLRIFFQVLKFSASSLVGFGIDYLLYSLLVMLLPEDLAFKLIIANVCARIVSSSVNFTINLKLVFKPKVGIWRYRLKYICLATFILTCNTLLLNLLVTDAGWDEYLAKLFVEVVLYIFSFLVQKFVVFKNFRNRSSRWNLKLCFLLPSHFC